MYHSLSKLLHETQATAAIKLGILENAMEEYFPDPEGMTDYAQNALLSPSETSMIFNQSQASDDIFSPQEHPIW